MTLQDITISLELSKRLKELGAEEIRDEAPLYYWGISEYDTDKPELTAYENTTECKINNLSKFPGVWSYESIEIGSYKELYPAYTTDELLEILEDKKASTGLNMYYQNDNTLVAQLVTGEFSKGRKLPDILAKLLVHLIENKLITI